jgi:hypothetical protein
VAVVAPVVVVLVVVALVVGVGRAVLVVVVVAVVVVSAALAALVVLVVVVAVVAPVVVALVVAVVAVVAPAVVVLVLAAGSLRWCRWGVRAGVAAVMVELCSPSRCRPLVFLLAAAARGPRRLRRAAGVCQFHVFLLSPGWRLGKTSWLMCTTAVFCGTCRNSFPRRCKRS